MPKSRRVPLLRAICFLIFLFAFAGVTAAADLAVYVPELAGWIESKLAAGQPLALTVVNRSSLSSADAEFVRRELSVRLEAHLRQFPPGGASAAQATVTLAESQRSYVWVVELVSDGNRDVHILEFKRPRDSAAIGEAPQMLVRSQKVFEQELPILDFAVLEASANVPLRLLILEPGRLIAYVWDNARWKKQQAAPILAPKVASRDLRGRLEVQADSLAVFLPGIACSGKSLPGLALDCQEHNPSWKIAPGSPPVSWVAGRNYLEATPGESVSAHQAAMLYSSAEIEAGNGTLRAVAALDGRTLLYDVTVAGREGEPVAAWTRWGSELAALKSGCGSGWQILATRPGDDTEPDALQAFEISERQPVAVSPPAEMHGPVVALWPVENGAAARAVVRNIGTKRYEAIALTLACGR